LAFLLLNKYKPEVNLSPKEENMRVLIVDDNQEIAWATSKMLEEEGIEVRSAMDGEEGFRAFLEFKPDLIITDIQMPGENGIELMKQIRRHNPLARNIYMSGDLYSFWSLLEEEKEKYSVSVLEKPFSKVELMGLVSGVSA
jgi:CheY-like chemotaxis protein